MDDPIEIHGEINRGWQSYWGDKQKEHQNTMSETVSATTDDDLHSEETVSLPEEVNRDGLTLAEENIIEAAVVNQTMSSADLATHIEKDRSYVEDVLRENCPEWYNNTFKEATEYNRRDLPENVAEEIERYIQSNNGVTRQEIMDAVDISESCFYNNIDDVDGIRSETSVPGYHGRTKVYYPDDSNDTPITKAETVEYEVAGDGEESDSDTSDGVTISTEDTELQASIRAMKATAEYDETVRALEVVEEYL